MYSDTISVWAYPYSVGDCRLLIANRPTAPDRARCMWYRFIEHSS